MVETAVDVAHTVLVNAASVVPAEVEDNRMAYQLAPIKLGPLNPRRFIPHTLHHRRRHLFNSFLKLIIHTVHPACTPMPLLVTLRPPSSN